jgi:hypothetical protein
MDHLCSICLDKIENEKVYLSCHHSFHSKCLTESLKYNKNCPYCRQEIKECYLGDCSVCNRDFFVNYFFIKNTTIYGKVITKNKVNSLQFIFHNQDIFCSNCSSY